jgi:GT2 family glycosyltransferase
LPPQNDGRDIDELRRSVDALGELLRQERIRTEALRARLNQQEAQIRELQRSTRSILDSRIWKTLVRLGGQVLWFQQQQNSFRTRLLMGRSKLTGGNTEIVQFHKDTPTERTGGLSGKIRVTGWAVAPSGIDAVRVRVDEGRAIAATTGLSRTDIGAVFPNHEGAANSGFRATLDLTGLAEGPHTLHIEAVSNTGATADAAFSIEVGGVRAVRTAFEIRSALQSMTYKPVFSILTPVYNTPEKWLRRVIDSVLEQQYPHWELCIADDCSTQPHVRRILDEYIARDQRIKVVYRDRNGHIAEATNSALEIATGEFIALLDHDDELTADALFENAIALNERPTLDFVYSDEDKIDEEGVCSDPFYKPDWSPDFMLTCMYTCHLGVYRTSLVREIGGFRPEVNGAQDYDLALRIAARSDRIHHIPRVLYHWRTLPTSTASGAEAKDYAYPAAQRAIANYLHLVGTPGKVLAGPRPGYHRVLYDIQGKPRVSVVIPSAGRIIDWEGRQIDLLRMCVGSILEKSTWPEIEIIVIHNNDLRPDLEKWLRTRAKLVAYTNPNFNLAEKINIGARHATGEHLIIQNDDTEVIAPDWIEHMLRYSQQPRIGAVGAKLLFPDNRIQHAGVVLLNGAPGHAYYNHPSDEVGYFLSVQVPRNYIAVTGACMMTRTEIWNEVGGFSKDFPLNYNDVDYCLKVREKGYRTVYVPEAELYHYESVSREAARGVKPGELEHFQRRWMDRYFLDPYYSPNLPMDYPYYYPD